MATTRLTYTYNPGITFELLNSIAQNAFPDCDIHRDKMVIVGPAIIVNKSAFVQAKAVILHKEKKNKTVVKIFPEIPMKTYLLIGVTFIGIKARKRLAAELSEQIKRGITERLGIVAYKQ